MVTAVKWLFLFSSLVAKHSLFEKNQYAFAFFIKDINHRQHCAFHKQTHDFWDQTAILYQFETFLKRRLLEEFWQCGKEGGATAFHIYHPLLSIWHANYYSLSFGINGPHKLFSCVSRSRRIPAVYCWKLNAELPISLSFYWKLKLMQAAHFFRWQ